MNCQGASRPHANRRQPVQRLRNGAVARRANLKAAWVFEKATAIFARNHACSRRSSTRGYVRFNRHADATRDDRVTALDEPGALPRAPARLRSRPAGTRSITTRSGKETKSQICGPIGVCRLKPRLAKRRSLTSACHNARSASVGLRRSSRARPRTGPRSDGTRPLAMLGQQRAQHFGFRAVEHAAARRALCGPRRSP